MTEPEEETSEAAENKRRSPDPELTAIRRILDILSDLRTAARNRVVAYLVSREQDENEQTERD